MRHELKCWSIFFEGVMDRTKNFELRKNDRNFKVGDTIVLMEFEPIEERYTGKIGSRKVKSIIQDFYGLKKGYCILGF